ncbi:conserved hypothetical protein [Vibrio crassostreae]|nr:conserved hypothetical protein [Vibrio crassostreae]CAK2319818.1 conserved hypothetical protein [Vibrio crassostreae]
MMKTVKVNRPILAAIKHQADEDALRDLCVTLVSNGETSLSLYDEFVEICKTQELDEDYENVIFDVMDALSGWCSPAYSLETASHTA